MSYSILKRIRKYESELPECDPSQKDMVVHAINMLKKTLKNDKRTKEIDRTDYETSRRSS